MLLLLVYVDDILITGESSVDVHHVITSLHQQFALKTMGYVNYFLGFGVTCSASNLHLNQSKYALDLLRKTNMLHAKPSPTPMSLANKLSLHDSDAFAHPTLYRSTIGALQYLTLTRHDLSFSVNKLNQYLHVSTTSHWSACKRILLYIKGTLSFGLTFFFLSHS